jgi:hypothetical protein
VAAPVPTPASVGAGDTGEQRQPCPFCGEPILAGARKCRFCGEWLTAPAAQPVASWASRGTADARAVSKGIKEKEFADFVVKVGSFIALAVGAVVYVVTNKIADIGGWAWIPAVLAVLAVVIPVGIWYWRE